MRNRLVKWVALLVLLVLFTNPDVAGFSMLLDAVGIALFLMIFAVQFLAYRLWLWEKLLKPVARFFADFSTHPVFLPTLKTVRKSPGILAYTVPLEGLLIVSCVVGIPAGTMCGY